MHTYEDLRLAPVFISNDAGHRLATAFVVTVPVEGLHHGAMYEHAYLVTAKHCVIDSATRTPRENLRIEFPFMGGQGLAVQTIRVEWLYLSPEDLPISESSLDLAVGPLMDSAFTGHQIGDSLIAIPSQNLIKNRSPALLGEETISVGLFTQSHGDENMIEPILRFGRVAALPRLPIDSGMGKAEAVLVEGHAAEGMSGAPVFVRNGAGDFDLLGIHVGHFTSHDSVDFSLSPNSGRETPDRLSSKSHAGVAIITPAWRVWELLNSPTFIKQRRFVEEEIRDFPWRFRDRRHRNIRGIVFSRMFYASMSDHPEAHFGRHEYLIHSPANDPYCKYGGELECNSHGAAELGGVKVVKAALAAEWPSVVWAETEVARISGRIQFGDQVGELTLYEDQAGQVRAVYLSGFWNEIDWGRFREAREGLERSLERTLWFADIRRGDYAVD